MKIVIIGGIAAGMSVAAKARRENPQAFITVIEKESYISFGACGLPYYLGGLSNNEKDFYARTPQQMIENGITILTQHEAKQVNFDKKQVLVKDLSEKDLTDQKTTLLPYDRLMIATGAMPIIPPLAGVDSKNVYTITRFDEVKKLRTALPNYQKIGIIGGGFIGIEVAEQLAQLGKKVTLIEATDQLINRPFDKEFSEKIACALEEIGVEIKLNTMINVLQRENNRVTHLKSDKESIAVDAVILAIGFKPQTDFIDDPRLNKLKNGAILINEYGETSIPDVFSAGDCATIPHKFLGDIYLPLATGANKMGRIIGSNIVHQDKSAAKFIGSLGSSALKIGNYEAGSTGLTEGAAKELALPYNTTTIKTSTHPHYYPNPTPLHIKLVYNSETKILLGAQIFGEKAAVLRMTGLTTAIFAKLTTDEIGFIDYAYAPPFAHTWEALNIAANTAK